MRTPFFFQNKRMTIDEELSKIDSIDNFNRKVARYIRCFYERADIDMQKKQRNIPKAYAIQTVFRGIVFGDIFGSPYEGCGLYDLKDEPDTVDPFRHPRSMFTDDSVMSLAISVVASFFAKTGEADKKHKFSYKEICDRYAESMRHYAVDFPGRGYGGNFYNWAVCGVDDENYKSFGNGSAMRVGTIGAYFDDPYDVITHAVCTAMPTHSHTEGIKGAVVTALAVWMGLHGYEKSDILTMALQFYPDGFTTESETYNKHYMSPTITTEQIEILNGSQLSVTCQITVPEAISNFIHSDSYESCLRNALRYACDSDTVGAISGGIAAAFYMPKQCFAGYDDLDLFARYFNQPNTDVFWAVHSAIEFNEFLH